MYPPPWKLGTWNLELGTWNLELGTWNGWFTNLEKVFQIINKLKSI